MLNPEVLTLEYVRELLNRDFGEDTYIKGQKRVIADWIEHSSLHRDKNENYTKACGIFAVLAYHALRHYYFGAAIQNGGVEQHLDFDIRVKEDLLQKLLSLDVSADSFGPELFNDWDDRASLHFY